MFRPPPLFLQSKKLAPYVLSGVLLLCLFYSSVLARTKLHVGALTIDGQTVRDVSCELETGRLAAVMKLVGNLSKQKKALDACAPEGAAFRVKWTWIRGKATEVTAMSASEAGGLECVMKILRLTPNDNDGDCQAIVLVGKFERASKRADTLLK